MTLIDDDGKKYKVVSVEPICADCGEVYGEQYDHTIELTCNDDDCCSAFLYLKEIEE